MSKINGSRPLIYFHHNESFQQMLKAAITLKELCRDTIKALKVSNEITPCCPNKRADIPALLQRRVNSA